MVWSVHSPGHFSAILILNLFDNPIFFISFFVDSRCCKAIVLRKTLDFFMCTLARHSLMSHEKTFSDNLPLVVLLCAGRMRNSRITSFILPFGFDFRAPSIPFGIQMLGGCRLCIAIAFGWFWGLGCNKKTDALWNCALFSILLVSLVGVRWEEYCQ